MYIDGDVFGSEAYYAIGMKYYGSTVFFISNQNLGVAADGIFKNQIPSNELAAHEDLKVSYLYGNGYKRSDFPSYYNHLGNPSGYYTMGLENSNNPQLTPYQTFNCN
jgi:hypothetical protein